MNLCCLNTRLSNILSRQSCRVLGRRRVVTECGASLKGVHLSLLKPRLSRIGFRPRSGMQLNDQSLHEGSKGQRHGTSLRMTLVYESHDLEAGPTKVSSLLERESL